MNVSTLNYKKRTFKKQTYKNEIIKNECKNNERIQKTYKKTDPTINIPHFFWQHFFMTTGHVTILKQLVKTQNNFLAVWQCSMGAKIDASAQHCYPVGAETAVVR